jgi:HAD superfamily hydrolase (TIGR01450 family)
MPALPRLSMPEILERYEVLFLDAYGVLNDHDGALPDAPELIAHLGNTGKPYLLLTNDASRTPETSSRRFRGMGLDIPPDRILTSGLLLARYFEERGLAGARCVVLGPEDSLRYVEQAGGKPVPLHEATEAEALVVCDEAGFPFRPTLDLALSFLYRELDRDRPLELILANPDLVYPASPGRFGFTAGSIALLLEGALQARYPGHGPRFTRLGKPSPRLFEEAGRRHPGRRAVMVGDQLETDVRGARDAGIDSVLVIAGVSRAGALSTDSPLTPTFVLESLRLG